MFLNRQRWTSRGSSRSTITCSNRPTCGSRYLPAGSAAPRPALERIKGRFEPGARGGWVATDDGGWADIWRFESYEMAIIPGFAAAGMDQDYLGLHWDPLTYDEMRPGCFEQAARLEDMDANHTEASLSFPTFPRFCGQTFLEHGERELGPGLRRRPTTTG